MPHVTINIKIKKKNEYNKNTNIKIDEYGSLEVRSIVC